MSRIEHNMSLTGDAPESINTQQKIATILGMSGLLQLEDTKKNGS